MKRYVQQLVFDLEQVAANPPAPPYIEPPPHLANDIVIAELALTPYKTIGEWTGISQDEFPEMIQLSADQMHEISQAIFKVFNSMNIELVDAPADLPPEMLYDVITTNWAQLIQYLPNAGFDLEFCTSDSHTCPYGDYCDCGLEHDFSLDDEPPSVNQEDERIDGLPF